MDGARLGYGLMSDHSDMTIEDVANYCDIFILVELKSVHCAEKQLYLRSRTNPNILRHVLNIMAPF